MGGKYHAASQRSIGRQMCRRTRGPVSWIIVTEKRRLSTPFSNEIRLPPSARITLLAPARVTPAHTTPACARARKLSTHTRHTARSVHTITKHALISWKYEKVGTGFRGGNPFPMKHAQNMQSAHVTCARAKKCDRRRGVPYKAPTEGRHPTRWSATCPVRPACPVPNPTRHLQRVF